MKKKNYHFQTTDKTHLHFQTTDKKNAYSHDENK